MDIDYGSPRVRTYTKEENQVALEDAIDQLDEVCDVALLHSAKYQQALRRYHERNVRTHKFQVGDLVLRRVQGNKDQHKLSSHGMDRSSSIKYSDPERSRSNTRTVESSPKLGTSSIYCCFTLK
jgi:hypothetical protein